MDFNIKNLDSESPILAFKSTSLVSVELVFGENENRSLMTEVAEWFGGDGQGPFRSVQKNDELKLTTMPSYDEHRFKALFSHPLSEKELKVLLTTLVEHDLLNLKYLHDLHQKLTFNFAKSRLLSLQIQLKQLLKQLEVLRSEKHAYLARLDGTQSFVISDASKKEIFSSIQRLNQVMAIMIKMSEKNLILTKEEMSLLQSFKPSCYIQSSDNMLKAYWIDEQFADDLALFVRDFNAFLADSTKEQLSMSASLFGLYYKASSDHEAQSPEAKSARKVCVIL